LDQDSALATLVLDMYASIISGATIGQLRRAADKVKAAHRNNVI
jgi:hypothetical protein